MAAVEGKGRHRSIVQRRELLARQRQSGLSVAAFCRERSLSIVSFYRWRRELAGTDAAPAGLAERAGFIELGSLGKHAEWELELDLGGGVVLRLRRA